MGKRGSRPVDEKIISMKMDNTQFKEKAKETENSFTKLNEKIKKTNFKDMSSNASASFRSINSSAKGVNFSAMERGIDNLNKRFSLLQVAARAAFSTIIQNGINKATNSLKYGGFSPIAAMKNGLEEYYTQLGSIRVMRSNTGGKYTEKQINSYLDNLNEYADKTIYKFDEMTRNLGIFTAAGIKDLDVATTAIKGLMNFAADQGVDNNDIMRATYQLSQALAAGRTTLIDWKSVENARLGGAKFKETLIQTAQELGYDPTKSKNYKKGGFRGSLEDGWLTNEVMLRTLKKFADDPEMFKAATEVDTWKKLVDNLKESYGTGWADTWKVLFGGIEESTKLFTGIKKAIDPSFDALKKWRLGLAQAFKDADGVENFFTMIINAGSVVKAVFERIGAAWKNVFPEDGKGIVIRIAEFFGYMADNNEKLAEFIRTSKAFDLFQKSIELCLTSVKFLVGGISSAISIVREFVSPYIQMAIEGIVNFGHRVIDFVRNSTGFGSALKTMISKIRDFNLQIRNPFEGINIWDKLKKAYSIASDWIVTKYNALKEYFNIPTLGAIGTFALFAAIGLAIRKGIKIVTKAIAGFFDTLNEFAENANVFKHLKKFLDNIANCFKDFTKSFRTASLLAVAIAISAMALSLRLLATIDAEGLDRSIAALTVLMGTLIMFLKSVGKVGNQMQLVNKKNGTILNNNGKTAFLKMTVFIMGLSFALLMLTGVIGILGRMRPETLQKGVGAIVIMLGMLAIVIKAVGALNFKGGNKKFDIKFAGSFMSIGLMVVAIAGAIKLLSTVDAKGALIAVVSVSALLTVLIASLSIMKGMKYEEKDIKSLNKIMNGLSIFMLSMTLLSTRDPKKVAGSALAVGLLFGALTGALKILNESSKNGNTTLKNAVALTIVGTSLGIIAISLLPLTLLPIDKLTSAVIALGSLLVIMGMSLSSLNKTGSSLKSAGSIAIVSSSLILLAGALTIIGILPMKFIGKGLLIISYALLSLSIAGYALKPVGDTILNTAKSFAIFGLGVIAFSTGIWIGIQALKVLGRLSSEEITKIASNFSKLLDEIIKLGPKIALLVGEIIVMVSIAMKSKSIAIALAVVVMFGRISSVILEKMDELLNIVITGIIIFMRSLARTIRSKSSDLLYAIKSLLEAIVELVILVLAEIMTLLFFWIPGAEDFFKKLSITAIQALRSGLGIKDTITEKTEEARMSDSIKQSVSKLGEGMGESTMKGLDKSIRSGNFDDTVGLIGQKINNSGEIEKAGDKFGSSLASSAMKSFKRDFDISWILLGKEKTKNRHQLEDDREKHQESWNGLSTKQKKYFKNPDKINPVYKSDPETQWISQFDNFGQYAEDKQKRMESSSKAFWNNYEILSKTGNSRIDSVLYNHFNTVQQGFEDAYKSGGTRAGNEMNRAGNKILSTTNSFTGPLISAGKSNGSGYASGVGSKSGEASSSGRYLASSSVSAVEHIASYGRGYSSGQNYGEGFAQGIESKRRRIQGVGAMVGGAAVAALRAALDEHSPSKKTEKSGINFVLGMFGGIKEKTSMLIKEIKSIGIRAIDTLNETYSEIQNSFNNPIDLRPTVIPTVDWSSSEIGLNSKTFSFDARDYVRPIETTVNNNEYNTYNNKGIFEGATFVIREDADINKIATEIERIQKLKGMRRGAKEW